MLKLIRTDAQNADLLSLVALLDEELRQRDGEDHYFFAQFNKLAGVLGVVVAYVDDRAVGCGAFKRHSDVEAEIIAAVNELRARYTYVFTTGGIGPTHDDVTTDAVARAFGVEVLVDPEAVAVMRKRFSDDELTPARLRMARIPRGASLIDNAISRAPGFMLENVIVMAGVPRIMQVMLDAVAPRLVKGRPILTRSVRLDVPEGDAASGLADLQAGHPEVQIGSYPFFENKRLGTYVVLRSADADRLAGAVKDLWKLIERQGFHAVAGEDR